MTYRCIKPQCPPECSQCNCALPRTDTAAMLVADLLDAFAVDGFGGVFEDGESELVDRARAWLAQRPTEAAEHDAKRIELVCLRSTARDVIIAFEQLGKTKTPTELLKVRGLCEASMVRLSELLKAPVRPAATTPPSKDTAVQQLTQGKG